MADKKLMGFSGVLKQGTAGATATTVVTTARDVSYGVEPDEADVSDRGSIFNLKDVPGVSITLEFEINNKQNDAFTAAVRAAVIAGTAMAFKTEDETSGYGVDADFVVGLSEQQPLRDAQRLRITASPTDKEGRVPVWA